MKPCVFILLAITASVFIVRPKLMACEENLSKKEIKIIKPLKEKRTLSPAGDDTEAYPEFMIGASLFRF